MLTANCKNILKKMYYCGSIFLEKKEEDFNLKKKENKLNFRRIFTAILIFLLVVLVIKFLNKKEESQVSKEENILENQINVDEEKTNEVTQTSNQQKSSLEEKLVTGNILGEEGLPVLMYHFFYDKTKGAGQDGNWIEIADFEEQMKYLSENDFYFPTWEEVEEFIDKKQELPEKSVVITVDDGDPSFFELAVPVIQKYKIPVTSFVITYWYGNRASDKQEYVDYQSHSYDMHKAGANGKGVMLSWDYEKIKEDILLSSEVLGGANIFCYPFGQYNDLDIKVLKENGYKLAFTTQPGRVKKGASKYELPRVRVSGNTSLSSFISKVE